MQVLGNLRGLAAPRLAHQDHRAVLLERKEDVLAELHRP